MGGPAFFFVLSLCVLCISPTPSRLRRTLYVHLHAIGAWLLSVSRWSSPAAAFLDPRGPDASSRPRDAGTIQVRVDRRARRGEALLLDDEGRHEAALVAHDAGAQVPVDDEAADARDLVAF